METKEEKTKKTKWQFNEFLKQKSTKWQLWLGGGLLVMVISIIIILNATNRINPHWTIIGAIIFAFCVLWCLILSLQFANYFRGKTPPKEHTFFKTDYTDEKKQKLFDELVNGGLIHKDTKIENFLFAFGGSKTNAFKPIQWIETSQSLGYFIKKLLEWDTQAAIWEKTKKCFVLKDGKDMNTDSMKTYASNVYNGNIEKSLICNRIDDIFDSLKSF